MFDQLYANLKALLFPDRDRHAIPMLDGPFRPDNRLEALDQIGAAIPACDDLACGGDGEIYVSSGQEQRRRGVGLCFWQTLCRRFGRGCCLARAGARDRAT